MSGQKLSRDYKHAITAAAVTALILEWQGQFDFGYLTRLFAWLVVFALALIVVGVAFGD